MSLEDQLGRWTKPSSDTEKDKQERTERMVRKAISDHPEFHDCNLTVYAKGSYPNNTNVRLASHRRASFQAVGGPRGAPPQASSKT